MLNTFYLPVLGGFQMNWVYFFILGFLSEKGQKIVLTCFQHKVFLFSNNLTWFLREKYYHNVGNLRNWERFPQDSSLNWFILENYLTAGGRSWLADLEI